MRTQLNIYVNDDLWAMPGFDGFVPRKNERIIMQNVEYLVKEVIYEFIGSPLQEAHINVVLKKI